MDDFPSSLLSVFCLNLAGWLSDINYPRCTLRRFVRLRFWFFHSCKFVRTLVTPFPLPPSRRAFCSSLWYTTQSILLACSSIVFSEGRRAPGTRPLTTFKQIFPLVVCPAGKNPGRSNAISWIVRQLLRSTLALRTTCVFRPSLGTPILKFQSYKKGVSVFTEDIFLRDLPQCQ